MTGNPTRILVVDEDEPVRRLLGRVLGRDSYECNLAADAGEAKAALAMGPPYELLLTAMDLPRESGLDLIEFARAEHPDLATVMVTRYDDTYLADAALDLGAYGYIVKPFEPNEILITVSNALRRRRLEIENRSHTQVLERIIAERTAELWNAVSSLERSQEELRSSRERCIDSRSPRSSATTKRPDTSNG